MSASKRMKDKSKIIESPNSLREATTSYDEDDLYDFEWLEKPVVLRMFQEIVDTCYELLKRKRKPRSVIELHMQFIMKGYLLFTEQDLLEALVKDGRFGVENQDSAFWAEVCAARKDRR